MLVTTGIEQLRRGGGGHVHVLGRFRGGSAGTAEEYCQREALRGGSTSPTAVLVNRSGNNRSQR